ncbi:MAG: 50S ribosomal protein L20 [Opitutales bacterium]
MPKVTNAVYTRKRRKRVLKQARGYFGNKSRLYRYAKDAVQHAGKYAYRDRRVKRREFRRLWIVRINSVCRAAGFKYSQFICALKTLEIELDRKQLAEMAIHDEAAFNVLVEKAKAVITA